MSMGLCAAWLVGFAVLVAACIQRERMVNESSGLCVNSRRNVNKLVCGMRIAAR